MKIGKLFLIPITITEDSVDRSIPTEVLDITHKLDYFIVERAKTARRYLKASGIQRPLPEIQVEELNKHKPEEGVEDMLQAAFEGRDIGLMSEAGCPAVADPGALVVMKAHLMGIEVVPLVGPSSILLSLMGSGFNGQKFTFHGYLPYKDKGAFKSFVKEMERGAKQDHTHIFIETPYRNDKTFQSLLNTLPNFVGLSVAVDLLGKQQKIQTFTIAEWKKVDYHVPKEPAIFVVGKVSN